ncbi:MAG: TonB-dependent receptor [Acidobacteriota bacterium]
MRSSVLFSRCVLQRLLCLAVLCVGSSAPAVGEETQGRVVDRFARPLSGVRVQPLPEGGAEATTSDDQGLFVVPSSVASVRFEHPEFLPLELALSEVGRSDVVLMRAVEVEETVLVAGSSVGDRFSPHSIVSSVVEVDDRVVAAASVAEAARDVSGVAENGQGGLFQVLSIRGASRQRVLALLGGVRLTSERRAGVAASFVDPSLLGDLEVVRGPASTYYGPGALGGALLLNPRLFSGAQVQLEWGSIGDENAQVFGWGGDRWSLGIARRTTNDGETPDGERLFDRYEQVSATLQRRGSLGGWNWGLLVLPSVSSDIGKPNNEDPERRTSYPDERHLLVRLAVESPDGDSSARLWFHPQELTTRVERQGDSVSVVDNESFDLGLAWQRSLSLGEQLDGRIGVEYFGRRGVHLEERISSLASDETLSEAISLQDAEADELGVLSVVNGRWRRLRWEAGGRLTLLRQDDGGRAQVDETALTGFLGAALPLGSRFEWIANVGRGVRMPTLSERYFVGTTGRGQVLGQPDLEPESSLNFETGGRWSLPRGYLLAQVFRNEIDDYIERIDLETGQRTFRNLTSGTLEGVEAEMALRLSRVWDLNLSGHWLEGRSAVGEPLADVPQAELKSSLGFERGRWRGDLRLRWRDAKDDPGPGEVILEDAWLADVGLAVDLPQGLTLTLAGRNLLDETFLPSADDRALPARGRALQLGLGVRWN